MKKNMLLWAWLMAAGMPALAQNAYLENLKLENRTVEKADGKVRVQADICLDGVDLKRQQSLRLVPVLVSADGTQEALLPAVVVEGRVRGKVTDRQLALGERTEEAGVTRVRRTQGEPQTLHYAAEVPFSRWMVNGRLEVRGYVTGCAACSEGDEVMAAGSILPYSEPTFTMAPAMQPAEEEVKRRAENKSARLEYRRDSYAVLPTYRTNRAELDSVQRSLALLKDAGIPADFALEVPHIINRSRTGRCPLETACDGLTSPEEIFPVITNFMAEMQRKSI